MGVRGAGDFLNDLREGSGLETYSDGSQYKGMVDCATKVMTKEGPLAFWTGFGAYYGRCAPHAMIILLSIDEVKKVYASIFIDK